MEKFHSDEYIDLLRNINESSFDVYRDHCTRFGFSADCPCPIDSKFYDFCYLYTKGELLKAVKWILTALGSILGVSLLNEKVVDHAINWSGGLHHAKRTEASG